MKLLSYMEVDDIFYIQKIRVKNETLYYKLKIIKIENYG